MPDRPPRRCALLPAAPPPPPPKAAAIGALRNLAVNDDLQAQLLEAGGVGALLGAARGGPEPAIRTAAVEALRCGVRTRVRGDWEAVCCRRLDWLRPRGLLVGRAAPAIPLNAASAASRRRPPCPVRRNLAVGSSEACTAIAAAGGVPAMVAVAHALPGAGRLAALGVLLVLSVEEPHKQAVMATPGGRRGRVCLQ
jgi:hypothetical protein